MFDHAARQRLLSERMHEEGVDLLFLGLSSDLEGESATPVPLIVGLARELRKQ